MAGNTRGKLKEHLEGMHSNLDWVKHHTEKSLVLIQEHNAELSKGFECIGKMAVILDEMILDIYSHI